MALASSSAISREEISIRPSRAFAQICGFVKILEHNGEVTLPAQTTVKEAVGLLSQEAASFDGLMSFSKPRTEKGRDRSRMLAKQIMTIEDFYSSGPDAPLPSRIWNTMNAAELSPPKFPSSAIRAAVKQKSENQPPFRDPYPIIANANVDEGLLAAVSARTVFRAIDADDNDPRFEVKSDYCLWDTGAQRCMISHDIFNKEYQAYLQDPIHDPYRNKNTIGLQVDCVLRLSNTILIITAPFTVVPLERMPNKRSGIIIGQSGFLDQLVIKTIPRSILIKMGTPVEENIWGEISLKMYIDELGELQKL